jgi:hypothetical protein
MQKWKILSFNIFIFTKFNFTMPFKVCMILCVRVIVSEVIIINLISLSYENWLYYSYFYYYCRTSKAPKDKHERVNQ